MKCYKTTFKIDNGLLLSAKLKEQSYLLTCITFRANYKTTALMIGYPLKIAICKYLLNVDFLKVAYNIGFGGHSLAMLTRGGG